MIEIHNKPKYPDGRGKEEPGVVRNAYILIGPATSGKTSLATNLAEKTDALKITGRSISESIDEDLTGKLESERVLMPDSKFIPVLEGILSGIESGNIVFDNVPRTSEQARVIAEWAEGKGYNLVVVSLELTEDQVVNRALERTVCPSCGASYHPILKPSGKPGICDLDGSHLVERKGDHEGALRSGYKNFLGLKGDIIKSLESKALIYNIKADGTTFKTLEEVLRELAL